MKVGDLVVNTYIGATLKGKLGVVVGLERFGTNRFYHVLVRYDNQTLRLSADCLKVVAS